MIKLLDKATDAEKRPTRIVEMYNQWKDCPYDLTSKRGIDSATVFWINRVPHIIWAPLADIYNFCLFTLPVTLTWAAIREKDSHLLLVFKKREVPFEHPEIPTFKDSTITPLLIYAFMEICYPNLEFADMIDRRKDFLYMEFIARRKPVEPPKPEYEFYIRNYMDREKVTPSDITLTKKETTDGPKPAGE